MLRDRKRFWIDKARKEIVTICKLLPFTFNISQSLHGKSIHTHNVVHLPELSKNPPFFYPVWSMI